MQAIGRKKEGGESRERETSHSLLADVTDGHSTQITSPTQMGREGVYRRYNGRFCCFYDIYFFEVAEGVFVVECTGQEQIKMQQNKHGGAAETHYFF